MSIREVQPQGVNRWAGVPGTTSKGKDEGTKVLGPAEDFGNMIAVEYVWIDFRGNTRSKTKTVTRVPQVPSDLPVWNFDGSSTEQAPGHDSEVMLHPVALFNDPFRGGNHKMCMCACRLPSGEPALGNHRDLCANIHEKYAASDPWYGIEQEYTLMRAPAVYGLNSTLPIGFMEDGREPAEQGPYYCGAGTGKAIGRQVADEHYAACLKAGIKVAGMNAEVMPGQWEFQIGPCRGLAVSDHLAMARYVLDRVSEFHNVQVSIDPKPVKDGMGQSNWNGAGCHTNFSTKEMRAEGGMAAIEKVCKAFGPVAKDHIAVYGEGNEHRLTGKYETASMHEFKFGVADRGASIRIPREAALNNRGYFEDRRPAANCDPYRVTGRMMQTAGEALYGK